MDEPIRHALGGDRCREYIGRKGECGAPSIDGLCDQHRARRERQLSAAYQLSIVGKPASWEPPS